MYCTPPFQTLVYKALNLDPQSVNRFKTLIQERFAEEQSFEKKPLNKTLNEKQFSKQNNVSKKAKKNKNKKRPLLVG